MSNEFDENYEEKQKTFLKKFLSLIFFFIVVILLILYWFFPFKTIEYNIQSQNHNFILNSSSSTKMQFYENMRYPNKKISYKITNCSLIKKNNMQRAFEILENKTILNLYSVNKDPKISITCSEKVKINPDSYFFIVGEGGPTNITKTDNFNVILHGKTLLLRESKCKEPNIELHELLHSLGFDHSKNPGNIMYNITKCYQTLGNDIPLLINEIYSYPSYSDLAFENASASLHQRYLNLNLSIRNHGLKKSEPAKINIYLDNESIKEIELEELEIGAGKFILLKNILVSKLSVKKITLSIETDFQELDKKNNEIILKIKQ